MPSRVVAALIAAVAIAGCGGGGRDAPPATDRSGSPAQRGDATPEPQRAEPTPEPPGDVDLIRGLLADRAAALAAGNPGRYAATATGAQRGRDRRSARRAAGLRLRDARLEVRSVEVDGRRARICVRATYELAGVPGSFESSRRVEAVRVDGRWRIRDVRAGRGLPPWEVAEFAEHRTRHFVVLAPPEVPVDELLPALEAGYDQMRELLARGSLRRRYLVVVAANAGQARGLTTDIRGVGTLSAISDAAILEEGPALEVAEVVSVRLLVNWAPFSALDTEQRARVITHELTHAALAGVTSGRTPAWLVEGVALYVSGDRRAAPPDVALGALSRSGAIARLAGEAQAGAYAASSAAAFAIADRYGRRALLSLYESFSDPALPGEPGRRLVNRALRRELGTRLAELEASLATADR